MPRTGLGFNARRALGKHVAGPEKGSLLLSADSIKSRIDSTTLMMSTRRASIRLCPISLLPISGGLSVQVKRLMHGWPTFGWESLGEQINREYHTTKYP
jgi:hypothetical protein